MKLELISNSGSYYSEQIRPLVVFGTGQLAELAVHYFRTDSERNVVALTADAEFQNADRQMGLPVVPFESLTTYFPPEECDLFIALSYRNRNRIRRARFLASREAGYHLASYVSSKATVLNDHNMGDNCFILEDATVQPYVGIGNNTTLWSGSHIGHHSQVGSHVFIAPRVAISGNVTVHDGVFLGINATLRDGITVGEEAIVGAGAVVMDNVNPGTVIPSFGKQPL